MNFAVPADHRIKLKEREKKYLDFARELKKTIENEGDDYTNRDWCFWYSHQRFIEKTGRLGGWRTSGDHPNYSIIENGQNTEKSSGDLRRLAVTQTPVKDHQLMLMWKTLMSKIIIIIIIIIIRRRRRRRTTTTTTTTTTTKHIIKQSFILSLAMLIH